MIRFDIRDEFKQCRFEFSDHLVTAILKTYFSFALKNLRYKLQRALFSRIAPKAYAVIVDTNFGPMACDPLDRHVSRQLMKWGHYNPTESDHYAQFANGLDSALIVGSHIGALAIQLAPCFNEMVCVEANPQIYRLLRHNIFANGLSAKVSSQNVAVSDREGPVPFLCNVENSGGSKCRPVVPDIDFVYDAPEQISVPAVTLDTEYEDRAFDFILMDIEGSEFGAILGGQALIRRCSVFVVEYVPNHLKRVANRSICEFADLLVELDFDEVYFPSASVRGRPSDCLLSTLLEIERSGGYEDGIIFTRHGWSN